MFHNMVDLLVKLVGLEQRSPPHENGMCNLQNSVRHFEVIWRDSADKVLEDKSLALRAYSHVVPELQQTCMSVSHLFQKSESAITLIASPSWVWMFGGDRIMRPTSSCLMVATSSAGSLWFPSSSCIVAYVRNVHAALGTGL